MRPTLAYPRQHLTRQGLVGLYASMADWALPHVLGRPLTLVRAKSVITRPDALRSQAAFVRHAAGDQDFVPASVPRVRIREQKKIGEYLTIDSIGALTTLLEVGVVEWHVWNARVFDVERPDQVVFDLDPGDGVSWAAVVTAARRLRAILEKRGLECWVKTTGGKGLHVVAPFVPSTAGTPSSNSRATSPPGWPRRSRRAISSTLRAPSVTGAC